MHFRGKLELKELNSILFSISRIYTIKLELKELLILFDKLRTSTLSSRWLCKPNCKENNELNSFQWDAQFILGVDAISPGHCTFQLPLIFEYNI
jgi:hypothetical protein